MSVTIREVAREAMVSVATVSRVLNGKGPVHADTARRIRSAAKHLHYVPHGGARSLITRKTTTLGVLLPELYGEFFSELIRGIDVCARRKGYHLLVSSSHSDRAESEEMVRAMRGRVDGLIVLSPDLRAHTLKANLPEQFPVVLVNTAGGRGAFDSLTIDNFGGAVEMVRHMVALGHRRIAFLQGPAVNRDAFERLRGYREAMAETGNDEATMEFSGDFREESGYEACRRILASKRRPSAVFAANDSMAIGLLCGFQEKGIRVPQDFAIAGFDDIPIARYVTPPLTSVSVPIAELGARAAELLIAGLEAAALRRLRGERLDGDRPSLRISGEGDRGPAGFRDCGLRRHSHREVRDPAADFGERADRGARRARGGALDRRAGGGSRASAEAGDASDPARRAVVLRRIARRAIPERLGDRLWLRNPNFSE